MIQYEKGDKRKTAVPSQAKKEAPQKEGGLPKKPMLKGGFKPLPWHKRAILFSVSLLAAIIISPKPTNTNYEYGVGDIARHDVKSPHELLVEDVDSTFKKKEEAAQISMPVYDFDEGYLNDLKGRISRSFALMREYMAEAENKAAEDLDLQGQKQVKGKSLSVMEIRNAYLAESRKARLQTFANELSLVVGEYSFDLLQEKGFPHEVEEAFSEGVSKVLTGGVINSEELIAQEKAAGIVVRGVKSQHEKIVPDFSGYPALSDAREQVVAHISSTFKGWPKRDRNNLAGFAASLIKPTLTLNKNETEKRKMASVEGVSPVYFQVKEGEMILREGEKVTAEHIMKLNALTGDIKAQSSHINIAGMFFLISALIYCLYHFSTRNMARISLVSKDLLFLAIIIVTVLLAVKLSLPVMEALTDVFPLVPVDSYSYFFTLAASAILVRVVLNSEVALMFSIFLSILAAIVMKNDIYFGIYTFVGSVVGIQMVRYCKYRVTLIKAGFYVGAANASMILVLSLVSGNFTESAIFFGMLFGLAGGIIAGVIVTGLTPIVEHLFGYTTNFKLLELANLDHPLLKELITRSPGTYHHSWIIGSLVEAAAEAINANSLLARVSALYHDIGKIKKPQYFFENQKGLKNPHDKLAPSLSSLIIIGHVKDGIDLAREYKLGKEITDIIPQHHGTRLMRFFYQKAKDQEDPEVHSVNEKDFRYPGPKPQTKEAGLVMLADAVEAAARTIQEPTPARIKALVKKLIGEIFADGQLDECELTLKDLNGIANSFDRVLNGIFHARIEYPDVDEGDKQNGGSDENNDRGKKETPGSKEEGPQKHAKERPPAATLQ